jgi:outer membrane protein TolC
MARNLFLIFTAVFGLITVFAAESADSMKLSPDEAVELAVKNNLGLERQRIGTDTKRRASAYSWNKFLPTLSVSGGANIANGQVTKAQGLSVNQTTNSTAFSGQVQAQLAVNFALFEAMNSLKLDYETGLLTLEQVKLQLERDVRKAYYNIMLLEEQVKQLEESLRNAEQQAASTESQYLAGRQPELNYLQARVNVETMKPSMDQAVNGLRLAKSNFAMTLGLPLDTDFELSPSVDGMRYLPLDTNDLVRRAKDNNPDIQVQKQQLRTLQSQRKAGVYQKWTPNLSLGWTGAFSDSTGKTGGATTDSAVSNGTFNLGLSWTATSLLPFSSDAQSIKDMDDSIKTLSIAIAQAEQGTELDINNKAYSLEQIRGSMEAQRATAELAERSYMATLTAYNNGLQSLLQVQNAELQLRSARLNLYQQESNYLQGLIDLEYSIGAPFGSLAAQSERQS